MTNIQEDEQQLERSPSYDSLFGCSSGQDFDLEELQSLAPQSPSQATVADAANSKENQATPINDSTTPPSWLGWDPTGGVTWINNGLCRYPIWTFEPTIQSVVATLKVAIGSDHEYGVQMLHNGSLSKLYTVSFDNQAFVMRVCLPLCPRTRTEAEVATLSWVSQHTGLPVPRVRAYDSSRNNPLGYEWVLMTKLEGKPLSSCWSSVTMGSKERLVKQIAAFSISAFRQPFYEGIGSIFKTNSNSNNHAYVIGELAQRATLDHCRGPFSEISDWMQCRLKFASSDLTSRLDNAANANEKETLQRMLDVTTRIEKLMPQFLSTYGKTASTGSDMETVPDNAGTRPTATMLYHDCLSLDNILVNDDGILTGVIDWQCIPCLPLHEACQFPAFLQQAHDRFQKPSGRRYLVDDSGPPHPAYSRDCQRYELTELRQLYVEEMLHGAPEFVNIWRDETSANLRDFEAAVQNCDNEFTIETVEEWVRAMEQGTHPTLVPKRLHELLV
ncbi:phosphotransferase enzyme family-domain-containing protein [Xylaria flabelliformis]|nr:phosphotransferase enzyme family-domain-containing protein [Xylaria flabelliformis]